MCDPLPDIDDGSISYTMDDNGVAPFDHGAIATYTCNQGFLLNGDFIRTCGDGMGTMGSWSGSAPSCDGEFYSSILGMY